MDEPEELTFEQWKNRAAEFLDEELGIDTLLEEDDPHDMEDSMIEAYEDEVSPEDFIRDAFSDDFASAAHDEDLHRQSAESLAGEKDDDEDEDEDDEDEEDEDDD